MLFPPFIHVGDVRKRLFCNRVSAPWNSLKLSEDTVNLLSLLEHLNTLLIESDLTGFCFSS